VLLRYLKAQAMVLLCGGLVGPIFLGVYFWTGQEPILKWMFWVGAIVTAIDVLAALALANFSAKQSAQQNLLETQGVLALAQVTGIAETGTSINDHPLVKVSLHIAGPGLSPFDAEDRVLTSVTRLPMITGRKLAVLVDPETRKFQIDWQRSALLSGVVPAQFTSDDDGKTYDLSGQAGPIMEILQILRANNVPVQGAVDIRSNPVVRQQVMAVVRRVAAKTETPMAPPAPAPPGPSTAQRLQELETLRAMGTVTEAEYTDKRAQIIAEL
jgi:hypothetical protein